MKITITYEKENAGIEEARQEGLLTTALRSKILESGLFLEQIHCVGNSITEIWLKTHPVQRENKQ